MQRPRLGMSLQSWNSKAGPGWPEDKRQITWGLVDYGDNSVFSQMRWSHGRALSRGTCPDAGVHRVPLAACGNREQTDSKKAV